MSAVGPLNGGSVNGSPSSRTEHLIQWAHSLTYDDLPVDVVERTKAFFIDWLACAVAGRDHASVKAMVEYARIMGPSTGRCEVVGYPGLATSAVFAALVNGASSHVVEQDDLHNSSMMHPVWPPFLDCATLCGVQNMKDWRLTTKRCQGYGCISHRNGCCPGRRCNW